MKKILLISNMYPSKDNPHYGVFVKNTENLLAKTYKIQHVVMCYQDSKAKKLFTYLIWFLKILLLGIFGNFDCLYVHFVWISALPIRIICFFHPNILLVENAHGGDLFSENANQKYVEYWAKKALKRTDYLIVPSNFYANVVISRFKYRKDKILVFPSGGIDKDVFHEYNKQECRQELSLPQSGYLIGYASRIAKNKGWDTFLEALELLHEADDNFDFWGIVIGTGAEEKLRDKRILHSSIKNNIICLNSVNQKALAKYYSSMDVFCFPTRLNTETLGLVGLEAMACKTLCVIANSPAPLSYANKENSLIFEKNSAKDCADKLLNACKLTQVERQYYIENATKTVSEYTTEKVQQSLIDFFASVLT